MPTERRQAPRVKSWFDGSWQGASGTGRCRLSDVSASGCFVHSLAAPNAGERTIVTMELGRSLVLSIESEVIYVEKTMGFGVKFHNLQTGCIDQLRQALDALTKATA